MADKRTVAILCGGRSAEHEVSLQSARNVYAAIDKRRFAVVVVGIDKQGVWRVCDPDDFLLHPDDPAAIALKPGGAPVVLPADGCTRRLLPLGGANADGIAVDVVFPLLHGTCGEDGTMQGLLELSGLPYVGAGVLGSAAGMDKDVAKRLLREAGLPVAPGRVLRTMPADSRELDALAEELGLPLFVKPARQGSSVGVSKVHDRGALEPALREALAYDRKILLEAFVAGREIECAVLGNDAPRASVPGEIVPSADFYSYRAKYIDGDGAALCVPAELDADTVARVQDLALQVYRTLDGAGMGRVDVFLQADGTLVVNELNTIPGFTRISMYPRLWEASGIGYAELIERLIDLAFERHALDAPRAAVRPGESR